MKDLDKLRDEMADEHSGILNVHPGQPGECCTNSRFSALKAGWSALLQHLERAAGEFDAGAALGAWYEGSKDTWMRAARWQFEADRARIGLLDRINDDQEITIKQLEARVKELEDQQWFGEYRISHGHEDSYWIEHSSGEGMGVARNKFNSMIETWYKENF